MTEQISGEKNARTRIPLERVVNRGVGEIVKTGARLTVVGGMALNVLGLLTGCESSTNTQKDPNTGNTGAVPAETAGVPDLTSTVIPELIEATGTATPEPTKAAPSMENLPAEWAGRIDRVEVMTDMQGVERTVAVEKSADPDGEPKLRALQWDAGKKEWVDYQPQVGWTGYEGGAWANYYRDDEVVIPDREELLPPLTYSDGTPIPVGLLGFIYESTGSKDGSFYMQGYILDIDVYVNQLNEKRTVVRLGVPLDTGDWQIINYVTGPQDGLNANTYSLESLTPSAFGKTFVESGILSTDERFDFTQLDRYFTEHAGELVGQPIITKMNVSEKTDDPEYSSYDQGMNLMNALEVGDPSDFPNLLSDLSPFVASEEMSRRITSQ